MVQAVGTDQFVPQVLADVGHLIGVQHVSLLRFGPGLAAQVVGSWGKDGGLLARQAAVLYSRADYQRRDPLWSHVPPGPGTDMPVVIVTRVTDIADFDHRRDIYSGFNLAERLSVLGMSDGIWVALNFYRNEEACAVSDDGRTCLAAAAPLLHALAAKHAMLAMGQVPTERQTGPHLLAEKLRALRPALSARQLEVCASALLGLTNAEIGRDMGVETSTVTTLRRRAYDRLGISSLAELFWLCL